MHWTVCKMEQSVAWCRVAYGISFRSMMIDCIVRSVVKFCQLFGCIVVLYHITLYVCVSTSVRTTDNRKRNSVVYDSTEIGGREAFQNLTPRQRRSAQFGVSNTHLARWARVRHSNDGPIRVVLRNYDLH